MATSGESRINASGCDRPILRDLVNHVVPFVSNQWYELGLQLLDPDYAHELDTIEAADMKNDIKICCRKMFSKWMKTDELASWDKVIEALTLIGLNDVARNIKQLLQQGCEHIQEVTENTKAKYRRKRLDKSSTEQDPWPPFHTKSFTTLALVNQKIMQLQTKEDTTTTASLRAKGCIDKICTLKSVTKLNSIYEIFTPNTSDDRSPISILIEGQPGIGKTTLAKEICLQWANNKLLTSDKLLLLLMLRDPNVQNITTIEHLVEYTVPKGQVQLVLNHFHTTNGAGVTFIIDGFDELSNELRQTSFFRNLIEGDILPNARVVVTSRPFASACLHQLVDKRIEILGFEMSSREQYVEEALKNSLKLQELKRHLQLHPNIDAICYIPLSMAIIVFLCLLGCLPQTATEMFASFILHIVCRHLKRTAENKHIEQLPHLTQQALIKLEKVAFVGLVTDKLVFTVDDLPDICKDDPTCYGLLQSVECYSFGNIGTAASLFNFIHLGVQEYFAAKYVASLPEHEIDTLLHESFLVSHYCDNDHVSVRLSNMWIMYCGITGGQCKSLRCYLSLSMLPLSPVYSQQNHPISSQDVITNSNTEMTSEQICATSDQTVCNTLISQEILKNPVKVLYLFQCFQEAKNDMLCNILSKSFDNGKIDLSNSMILPYQMVSLGFYLSRSQRKWSSLILQECLYDYGLQLLHYYLCGLKNNKQEIVTIDLSSNDLTRVSSPLIGDFITHLQPHTLKLGDNNLTGLRDISTAVMKTNTVKIMSMDCNSLTEEEALSISEMMTCLEELDISYNCFGDNGAVILSDGIKASKTLRELIIRCNEIAATGATAIAKSLTQNTSLEVLNMDDNCVGPEGVNAIVHAIIENKTLNVLSLINNDLDQDEVKIIALAINNNTLKELYIDNNYAAATGAIAIADALKNNISLEVLDMRCNDIGDNGAIAIALAIKSNNTLKKLNIGYNSITLIGAMTIAECLAHNTSLEVLTMNGNSLGQKGGNRVAHAIIINKTLKVLSLISNYLSQDQVKIIALVINHNTLKELYIGHNRATATGAIAIANVLTHNTSLEVLDMRCNDIGQDGAIALAQAISSNKVLKKLYISDNNITAMGAMAIAECLTQNASLEILDIGNNTIRLDGTNEIARAIANNRTLKELYVGDNTLTATVNAPFVNYKTFEIPMKKLCSKLFGVDEKDVIQVDSYEVNEQYYATIIIRALHNNNSITTLRLSDILQGNGNVKRETEYINTMRSKYNIPELTVGVFLENINEFDDEYW
ncbi:protein NLRC3-like isoform X2 [Dysidea avara]|uniref:protein NLRC3-like isoform X2 n=1 Tax=Dysidea avara TaxID=196820 RepID=UPI0033169E07